MATYNATVSYEELEGGIRIDKHALDDMWQNHPDLFHRVAKQQVWWNSEADRLKSDLERAKGEKYNDLRQAAVKKGETLGKGGMTEAAFNSEVANDKGIIKLSQEMLEARREANRWLALKESYEQRKWALQGLVSLYISGYYADTTGEKSTRQITQHHASDAAEARTEALQRRKNR
jgi:hypothetical protein